ncbi:MAG: SAM-dependent chlorinase/fluorinase [Geminicoccaceae bacterium]
MIHLFTDFGTEGPYLGEMTAVLRREAPEVPVVDLLHDAPAFRPELAAHLLAALLQRSVRPGEVVLAVVDPGVGGARAPVAVRCDGRWLVGPDNGLLEHVLRRAARTACHRIAWAPLALSASFHGRDLFAPVAARLARGQRHDLAPTALTRFAGWPDELAAIVQLDRYGNAITGLRAASLPAGTVLHAGGHALHQARTFADVPAGTPFWYENSSGLAELAVNAGSAAQLLGLEPGSAVTPDPQACTRIGTGLGSSPIG